MVYSPNVVHSVGVLVAYSPNIVRTVGVLVVHSPNVVHSIRVLVVYSPSTVHSSAGMRTRIAVRGLQVIRPLLVAPKK